MPIKDIDKRYEWHKEWRTKNAAKLSADAKERYAKNPRRQKSATLKYKYGITYDDYERMLEEQGGGCGICGTKEPGGRGKFHVDHDHTCCPAEKTCGKCIRGLLCHGCNTKLIHFESNWKERAVNYLNKYITHLVEPTVIALDTAGTK